MRFFSELKHVTALMSERPDGPMGSSTNPGEDGEYKANRTRYLGRQGIDPRRVVMAGLVNGIRVQAIFKVPKDRRIPDTDGLVSFGPAPAIAAQDCFPLLFAPLDPTDGHALVGIAHAGWAGVIGGIAGRMVTEIELRGIDRRTNLAVAIGPGIRNCCFLVRDDKRGLRNFVDLGYRDFVEDAEPGSDGEKRWRVDLTAILRFQLRDELSIPAEHIKITELCTCCAMDEAGDYRFFSLRRERAAGNNMLSVITLNTSRGVEALSL